MLSTDSSVNTYKARMRQYLRMMAIIAPYAQFTFTYVAEGGAADKRSYSRRYERRTDSVPRAPTETLYHPSALDLLTLRRLVREHKPNATLRSFLSTGLACIGREHAGRLIAELGPGFSADMKAATLTDPQLARMHQLFREARFEPPDGGCLSGAGEYNLRLGILKEITPDMVATAVSPVHVFEGHPFLVEAGVAVGGKCLNPGPTVYRFANRIPLLFEGGADVISQVALKGIKWENYKIGKQTPLGVFVSIVSTKIPFKGAGKEYIGADIGEMSAAVKAAVTACALQLKTKLVKQQALKDRALRRKELARYVPDVARALVGVLGDMAASADRPAKRARLDRLLALHGTADGGALLDRVADGDVTVATLQTKLSAHIDALDAAEAHEFAADKGVVESARVTMYLAGGGSLGAMPATRQLRGENFGLRLFV